MVLGAAGAGGALAAPSIVAKAGCPAITRAQADAAIGDVNRIEHYAEHTPGRRGGVTWLQYRQVYSGPGFKKTAEIGPYGGALEIEFTETTGRLEQTTQLLHKELWRESRDGPRTRRAAFRFSPTREPMVWQSYVFHPLDNPDTFRPTGRGPKPCPNRRYLRGRVLSPS